METINSWLSDQNHVPNSSKRKILEAEGPPPPQDVNLTRRMTKEQRGTAITACTMTDSKGRAILTCQLLEFYF
jgi:hypothetical protein